MIHLSREKVWKSIRSTYICTKNVCDFVASCWILSRKNQDSLIRVMEKQYLGRLGIYLPIVIGWKQRNALRMYVILLEKWDSLGSGCLGETIGRLGIYFYLPIVIVIGRKQRNALRMYLCDFVASCWINSVPAKKIKTPPGGVMEKQ